MPQASDIPPAHVIRASQSQLLAYFGLAYAISWGVLLMFLGARGFHFRPIGQGDQTLIFVAMLLGPSASAVALTLFFEGTAGLRELARRITLWRVGLRWYAVALLTTPVLVLPILWGLGALVDPAFNPQFRMSFFAIGLIAGFFEEIGWTGFATPRMLANTSVLRTGLTLGLIWALWHVLADLTGNVAPMGWSWPAWFVVFWMATLPAYRVLMTWVYARTGSVLLGMLMHAGYTGWLFVFSPATSVQQGLIWQSVFAAGLWVAAISATGLQRKAR